MKKSIYTLLFAIITISSPRLFAGNEPIFDVSEVVNGLMAVEGEVKKSGIVDTGCVGCSVLINPDRVVILDNKEIDLKYISPSKKNIPYIIHLKRSKDSPKNIVLKFKNPHTECAKMFIGANSFYPSGPLVIGCAYNISVYEDNELELDFKKFPFPKDTSSNDQDQIIELKISKPNTINSYYSLDAEVIKGASGSIKKSKKFWSNGFDLDFVELNEGKSP